MANFYAIIYDRQLADSSGLHAFVKGNKDFINWWHYLPTCYIIKTDLYLADVHTQLQNKWPKNRYLIIKVDPNIRNGWMPNDAWEWFHKRVDK